MVKLLRITHAVLFFLEHFHFHTTVYMLFKVPLENDVIPKPKRYFHSFCFAGVSFWHENVYKASKRKRDTSKLSKPQGNEGILLQCGTTAPVQGNITTWQFTNIKQNMYLLNEQLLRKQITNDFIAPALILFRSSVMHCVT